MSEVGLEALGVLEALRRQGREGLRSILTSEERGLNEAELPGYRPVIVTENRGIRGERDTPSDCFCPA